MDATQALICNTLGTQKHNQSVSNCQKRVKPYKAVTEDYVQFIGNNHWLVNFCSNGYVQIFNSLNSTLT